MPVEGQVLASDQPLCRELGWLGARDHGLDDFGSEEGEGQKPTGVRCPPMDYGDKLAAASGPFLLRRSGPILLRR